MTDAFKCERCEEFCEGDGIQTRYGVYLGRKGFQSDYDFKVSKELCKECKKQLDGVVENFFDTDD